MSDILAVRLIEQDLKEGEQAPVIMERTQETGEEDIVMDPDLRWGWRRGSGDEREDYPRTRYVTMQGKSAYRVPRDSDVPIDVVCVDGSTGADAALVHAAKHEPKEHELLLVHGIYKPLWSNRFDKYDEDQADSVEKYYNEMCDRAGRKCHYKHFAYYTTSGFGDAVCDIAKENEATSVVAGRRQDISPLSRSLMGSSSQSLLNRCELPLTIVSSHAE